MNARIIPLVLLGIISCVNLGLAWGYHGKKKTGKNNVYVSLVAFVIQWGLILWAIL